jgi:hypothetical protein
MAGALPGVNDMSSVEDFRFKSYLLLIELDAATMGMMLVLWIQPVDATQLNAV